MDRRTIRLIRPLQPSGSLDASDSRSITGHLARHSAAGQEPLSGSEIQEEALVLIGPSVPSSIIRAMSESIIQRWTVANSHYEYRWQAVKWFLSTSTTA